MDKTAPGVTEGMKGDGYYDAHSEYQRRIVGEGKAAIRNMVDALDLSGVDNVCTIADYGCGTGATSVQSVGTAVQRLRERGFDLPLHAIHADLITNDFNQVFRNIGDSYAGELGGPIYISAVGGSFFTQIIPPRTVHLGTCSNAAHWFRSQPEVLVSEGMYFSDARGEAREKLTEMAAADWLAFLRSRASEMVPGGQLLVQGIATVNEGGTAKVSAGALLRLMWEVARGMADDRLLDRPILDRYIFPVYCRSREEAVAPMLPGASLDGDFEVVSSEISEVANPYWEAFQRDRDAAAYARAYTAFVRAFAESTMMNHLFATAARDVPAARDMFFDRFQAALRNDPSHGIYQSWILRLVLRRC